MGGVSGWWQGRRGRPGRPPFISSLQRFHCREERVSRGAAVSRQRRVLKEDRRLRRPQGRFSFLASARDPHSSSLAPQSVREHDVIYLKQAPNKSNSNSVWVYLGDELVLGTDRDVQSAHGIEKLVHAHRLAHTSLLEEL